MITPSGIFIPLRELAKRWPVRVWVNQPSGLQPYHNLHGTLGLVVHEYDDTFRFYFLSGDTESQQILGLALSEGWPQHLRSRT